MTIEQIRQLPEDNWLGIKRIGQHAWQIGDSTLDGQSSMLTTGDGGVLDYVNTLFETMRKPISDDFFKEIYGKGLIDQINEGSPSTYAPEDLTYEKLEKIVREALYPREDGAYSKEE